MEKELRPPHDPIKSAVRSARPGLIFALFYLAYSCIYIARLNFSVAAPVLKQDGLITAAEVGIAGGLFSLAFALGKLAAGGFTDKANPKMIIVSGCLVSGAANLIICFAPPFFVLASLWAVSGFAQSLVWGPMLRMISDAYSDNSKKAVRVISMLATCVAVGSILAILVASLSISAFGVWAAFSIPGILLSASGLLVAALVKNSPPAQKRTPAPVKQLLRNRELRLMFIPAIAHGAIKDNQNLWVPAFFMHAYSFDLEQMTWYAFAIPVMALLGRLAYMPLYRLFKNNEKTVAVFAFFVCAGFTSLLFIGGIHPVLSAVALAVPASAVAAVNTTMASVYPMRFEKSGNVSSVTGLLDFGTYLGAAAGSLAYGFVVERFGYTPMFASWVALSLISAAVMHYIKKRYKGETV